MSSPSNQDGQPQATSSEPADPDHEWVGHVACVCHSTRGCDNHKEPEPFYNPLLPPNAPMTLREDSNGAWYISERSDEPCTTTPLPPDPSPLLQAPAPPSRPHKRLLSRFNFMRSSKTSNNAPSHDEEQGLLSCSNKLEEPEEDSQSPPEYSAISNFVPYVPYYPGHAVGDTSLRETTGHDLRCRTELPFDGITFGTLAPMYPSMPYHLAFYHLHHARKVIERDGRADKTTTVPLFTCSGKSSLNDTIQCYIWSSEVYFHKKKFLQKQEIRYILGVHSPPSSRDIDITMCPHNTVSLANVTLQIQDGWLKASAELSQKYHIYPQHPTQTTQWKSTELRLVQMHYCEYCYCDLERTLEVRGRELHVRFTVYRNLGAGIDRFDSKWLSLSTGICAERLPKTKPATNDVFNLVIKVAQSLKRPNLRDKKLPYTQVV
ncbi:hypothetical protein PG993_008550 [Apiospora rasikravindrae]|uniref:Uncharacterized protein n=1 Tax=Apiospora rasikravindrae TaxID=990691 RepID=A0ABR1T0P2_9PEZI